MKRFSFVMLMFFLLSSCVSSLYPISNNPEEYIFREEIAGEWLSSDDREWYRVERSNEKRNNRYHIARFVNSGDEPMDTTYFNAFLIKVGNDLYLDASPDMEQPLLNCKKTDLQNLLPTHAVYRLRFNGNKQISLGGMHLDSLKIFLAKKRFAPDHYNLTEDHLVLTAKPEVLKQKLLGNKDASFVFVEEEDLIFNRVK